MSEVQKPHPQPPPRKRGGGYDIPHVIRKSYNTQRLRNFDIFCEVKKRCPNTTKIWLDRLAMISSNDILKIMMCIPDERISPTAIEFAQKILELNQNELLNLQ